jgi:hypothetical protein
VALGPLRGRKGVDGRVEPGHDELGGWFLKRPQEQSLFASFSSEKEVLSSGAVSLIR